MTFTQPTNAVKAVYLNDFDLILGNISEESTLLAWIKTHKINQVYMYDLSAVLGNKDKRNLLAALILKLRLAGITMVSAIRGSARSHVDLTYVASTAYYQNERKNPLEKFDNFYLENEFWNYKNDVGNIELPDSRGAVIFRNWKLYMNQIRKYCQDNNLRNDTYIGQLEDSIEKTTSSVIANYLYKNTSRVIVDCYMSDKAFPKKTERLAKMVSRLSTLGKEAAKLGNTVEVVIGFGLTKEFIDEFYKGHTFEDAYNLVKQDIIGAKFEGKNNIVMVGWIIYGYREAKSL